MSFNRIPLLGLTLDGLRNVVSEVGMPSFAARQMAGWLYHKHVTTVDAMTNLSKAHRERLAEYYEMGRHAPIMSQCSTDGTEKFLFPVYTTKAADTVASGDDQSDKGHVPAHSRCVESVYIPDGERATLCVSCQVGCRMNCLFCQTGKQGFSGHLTAGDIINQIASLPQRDKLTNIVFMGQGEPADNVENVLTAAEILTADWGYGWSPRRITISSVGVPEHTERILRGCECHIAVSLHSPIAAERRRLVAAEGAMPIEQTIAMLRQYDWSHQRRLSFEYTVFGGINDTRAHGRALVNLLSGLDCRINLIRYHRIPDVDLPDTDEQRLLQLRDYLTTHGVFTTIRASRGQDIDAACGMLNTRHKTSTT